MKPKPRIRPPTKTAGFLTSFLAGLNTRIVQANRAVGRFFLLLWRGVCSCAYRAHSGMLWTRTHPKTAILDAVAILGFLYLAYEALYQTVPDIDVSSNETGSPFSLPFSVKTQSMLFDMHRTIFVCNFDMDTVGSNVFKDITVTIERPLEISRRIPGNFRCGVSAPPGAILSAKARVSARYCTNFLDIYCWGRTSDPTPFIWVRTRQSGYWIKGNL